MKNVFTPGKIITGILCFLAMGVMALLYYAAIGSTTQYEFLALGFFAGALLVIILTWLFSMILRVILKYRPLSYFAFCTTLSLFIMIITLVGRHTYFGTPVTSDRFYLMDLSYHLVLTFFLIPKIDGHYDWYEVTETTYVDNTAVGARSYLTKEYTSGTLIKILAQIIISAIFAGLLYANRFFAFLIFFFEGGVSIYFLVMTIRAYRRLF